ncbi:hypothetical protein [Aquimarina sp. 2201CG14-23]|uniref:hypothetical protein n=1 Tax=Aquimarina mycalae TaxID=3040073 RepID=UPI00247811D2|nr:hypothetical protein [Aquimarina sp. 2201CG14-23]MDH7444343.1 hypothetical protein [Aquimarina sp. 2201CG14-23]
MMLRNLFRSKMFLLVGITYLIFHFFIIGFRFPVIINKTVQWTWDITNLFFFFEPFTWWLFLVGYGILLLVRLKTKEALSIVHIGLIILSLIISSKNVQFEIILIIGLISLIVFVINLIKSIQDR